jgi:hypothetical protein
MARNQDLAPGAAELARAEELVDFAVHRLAGFTSRLSREVLKQTALAREEAEDIWAEAQSVARYSEERADH